MLATKPNLAKIFDNDMPSDALKCKDASFSLDDISSSMPSTVTNLLQKNDDLKTTIESRMTQIQEREDDEDINSKDATTAWTRCTTSSTSTTSSPMGFSATAIPYTPIGPSYYYIPWCCIIYYCPTGYIMYWPTTWPICWTTWPIC